MSDNELREALALIERIGNEPVSTIGATMNQVERMRSIANAATTGNVTRLQQLFNEEAAG